MRPFANPDWPEAYRNSALSLRRMGSESRLFLAGLSACIDRLVTLEEALAVLHHSEDSDAIRLRCELLRRAAAGIGGELHCQSTVARLLLEQIPGRASLGGTAAQAAYALAQLGAPVLLALQDRTSEQIALLHPATLIATAKGLVRAGELVPEDAEGKAAHIIVEYTAGRAVAGVVPQRTTRVIVRFADDGMDRDEQFVAASHLLAPGAAGAIFAGFNAIPPGERDLTLSNAAAIAQAWQTAGLALIHLELGDFPNPDDRSAVLTGLAGRFTSLGMSLSELEALSPGDVPVGTKARHLAEKLGVARVSIHADEWALSVTRGDPWREQQALVAGCLLAASRAAAGRPVVPDALPPGASFRLPHSAFAEKNGWYELACPAPWLKQPLSTIGLGDTFVAGTMLVLGRARDQAKSNHPSRF